MVNLSLVGEGQVVLIAGGGKTYTDVAAKFCRTERDIDELIASESNKELLRTIINSRHTAALEFDDFIFGVQGYARVTEVQLVRKRHASYMIKSGRNEKGGKRKMDLVIPDSLLGFKSTVTIPLNDCGISIPLDGGPVPEEYIQQFLSSGYEIKWDFGAEDLFNMVDLFYDTGLSIGIPEEELRYVKPQATEFKACIKMNAAALREWAEIRMCNRAQTEIRDLCTKMVGCARKAAPVLMEGTGPSCAVHGYCPEGEQCAQLVGKIPTKAEALEILKTVYGGNSDV